MLWHSNWCVCIQTRLYYFTSLIYFYETLNANTLLKNRPQDDEVLRSSVKLIVKWDAECFEICIINSRFNFPTFCRCSLSHWMVLVDLTVMVELENVPPSIAMLCTQSAMRENCGEQILCRMYLYTLYVPLNPNLVANLTQSKIFEFTE